MLFSINLYNDVKCDYNMIFKYSIFKRQDRFGPFTTGNTKGCYTTGPIVSVNRP